MIVENVLPWKIMQKCLMFGKIQSEQLMTSLTEEDIEFLNQLSLSRLFPAVALRCVKNDSGSILGFVGIYDSKVEMLFILNEARGQGVGKVLLQYAIEQLGATKVDVNEQNPKAVGFYEHMGFKVVSRSPLDDMGKPFPILHMAL